MGLDICQNSVIGADNPISEFMLSSSRSEKGPYANTGFVQQFQRTRTQLSDIIVEKTKTLVQSNLVITNSLRLKNKFILTVILYVVTNYFTCYLGPKYAYIFVIITAIVTTA